MQTCLPAAKAGFQVGQVQCLQSPLAFARLAVHIHVFKLKNHVQGAGLWVGNFLGLFKRGARGFAHRDAVVMV